METEVTDPNGLIIVIEQQISGKQRVLNGSKICVRARQGTHGAPNREEIASFICVM